MKLPVCSFATLGAGLLLFNALGQPAAAEVNCGPGFSYTPQSFTPPPMTRPPLLETFLDPVFGTCIQRVTDNNTPDLERARNIYSQLQPWNADGQQGTGMVLMHVGQVLTDGDQDLPEDNYQLIDRTIRGRTPRWSPTDPGYIYTTGNTLDGRAGLNQLWRYDLLADDPKQVTVVVTFPEYTELYRDASWEEMSRDGRYIALVGRTPNGSTEVFVYDVIEGRKSPVARPNDPDNRLAGSGSRRQVPNWAGVSPSGNYVLVQWSLGTAAYDINMNYLGAVNYGLAHSSIAMDVNGDEWHVDFAAGDSRSPNAISGPVIRKSRIPDGIDAYLAGDTSAVQVLLNLGSGIGGHVACHSAELTNSCIVSTDGNSTGLFAREIFELSLDSEETAPQLRRLAHHRSNLNCGYWAWPFAAGDRDGSQVMFGSNWGAGCQWEEAYVIQVPAGPPEEPPPVPADIQLTLGVTDNNQYGNGWGNDAHPLALIAEFQTDGLDDLELAVTGFDIDFEDEVSVWLNGALFDYLSAGTNESLNGGDLFWLPASDLVNGINRLEFRQRTAGWVWGVTGLHLDVADGGTDGGTDGGGTDGGTDGGGTDGGTDGGGGDPPADVQLTLGQTDRSRYGNGYGSDSHETELVIGFDYDAGAPWYFYVHGYDIDFSDEVSVWLNGAQLGHLRSGANNKLNRGDRFPLPAAQLRQGANRIIVRQREPGWIWGVTRLLIDDS